MKALLKRFLLWLLKNWRWLLPVLFFAIWYFGLDKHYLDFIAGAIFMSFIWYAYTHFVKTQNL
jgi:hypothetical protein